MDILEKARIFMITLVLLLSSILIVGGQETTGSRAPSIIVTNIHVNVTYPDGGPASGVHIKVHSDGHNYNWFRADSGYTNSSGQDWVYITPYNLGPCHLTVYNSSRSSFTKMPIYIWPDEEPHFNIVLTPALPFINVISGKILNMSGGRPTARPTSVGASGTDMNGLSFNVFNTTAADGSFELKVPNSSHPVRMTPSVLNASEKYLPYDASIFLKMGVHSYPMDIWLTPVVEPSVPVSLRFINPLSEMPITQINTFSYSGTEVFRDHAKTDQWFFSGTDWDGYLNLTMGHGEYIFTFSLYLPPGTNSVLGFDLPLMVNGTDLHQEIRILFPNEFRTVTFQINDSDTGDPIWGLQGGFNYRILKDGLTMDISSSYLESNSSGGMTFGILPDTELDVTLSSWGYESKVITIDAGPASSDVSLEISMDPTINVEAPMVNLSVLVKDEVSGLPIPSATIYGEGSYEGGRVSLYGITDRYGYYNNSVYAGTYDLKITSSLGTSELNGFIIPPNENTSIEVNLPRSDFREPYREVLFRLVDPFGSPLNEQPIAVFTSDHSVDLGLISDQDGFVRVDLRPDTYYLDNLDDFDFISLYRSHWIVPRGTRIEVKEDGSLGDIVLYTAASLDEISGFIRDKDTGNVIPYGKVKSASYHPLEGASSRNGVRDDPLLDEEKVLLYKQSSGSGSDGFYRVWGREMVELECYIEGYFPYREMIDLTTRTVNQHDIIVEDIPKMTTWVNGTLINRTGAPVQGTVKIFDGVRNEYLIGTYNTGPDGLFSIITYPGNLRVEFYNLTLSGGQMIDVSSGGIEDLLLELIPMTTISGVVKSPSGEPIGDASIFLIDASDNSSIKDRVNTTSEGTLEFIVEAGLYFIWVDGPDDFLGYKSDYLVATGWNDIYLEIFLSNRTYATEVWGTIIGVGGPYDMIGVPGINVLLNDENDTIAHSTITQSNGEFFFTMVDYGDYTISAEPPGSMQAQEEFYISGFIPNSSIELTVSGINVEFNMYLYYANFTPPGTFEITDNAPTGDDVSIVEPIRLWLSASVNETTVISALSFEPEVSNFTFRFNSQGTALAIFHDAFMENTTYTVTITRQVLSKDGLPIQFNGDEFRWNFTTGTSSVRWGLYSSVITIGYDRSWNLTVTGGAGQEVFIVIPDVGSFRMGEKDIGAFTSTYSVFIKGDNFDWNTTYWFHYSNIEDGKDLAVDLSGWRHMPDEGEGVIPPQIWEITDADVSLADNGDWEVDVDGNEGLEIFLIIPGLGSFLLTETEPGEYGITINASNFEGGKEYIFYFSNSTDGEDLSPEHGGSLVAKEVEKEDEDDKKERSLLWLLLLIIAILLILIAITVAVVAIRKQGEGEVMDWGEE